MRLVVSNTGDVPASEVRLEINVPAKQGVLVVNASEIPNVPKRRESAFGVDPNLFNVRRAIRHAGDVEIDKNDHRMKIEIDCGILQPGRRVWTDTFWLGVGHTGDFALSGLLFASNLSEPQEFTLTINATVSQTTMTVKQLVALDDPVEEDEP